MVPLDAELGKVDPMTKFMEQFKEIGEKSGPKDLGDDL